MSRSGYTEDYDEEWRAIMYRGSVASAIRGKRGQAFLQEIIQALDAMPEKRLITNDLINSGAVCAIGSVGAQRGIDMTMLNPDDPAKIGETFGIATSLVREIEWINDEDGDSNETPEGRWCRMRAWVERMIKQPALD